jgi:hypothetical protein
MSAVPHSLKVHECEFSEKKTSNALLILQAVQQITLSAAFIIRFCTLGWIHLEVYTCKSCTLLVSRQL